MMRPGIVVLVLLVCADAHADGAADIKALQYSLRDAAMTSNLMDDVVAISGLGFADATCQTKFGGTTKVAKSDRDTLAGCIAGLQLAQWMSDGWAAGGSDDTATHLLVSITMHAGKIAAFAPYPLASDGVPTVTVPALATFAASSDLVAQYSALGTKPDLIAKLCWSKASKPVTTIVSTSGIAALDDAFRSYLANAVWRATQFAGKTASVCIVERWVYAPPQIIPPAALETLRAGGTAEIAPDSATKQAIAVSGKDRVVSTFKLCVKTDGTISAVTVIKPSGFKAYDDLILSTIQTTWKFKPYVYNGVAVPVCTAKTFIYSK
jgi:hypothetical protein